MTDSRPTLTGEELYTALRRDMIDNRVQGGTVLQEEDIGRRYGVSRTPVREALQRLHQDNLIGRKGRFYVVASPSHDNIRQIYEFREAIETATVALCCERADEVLIKSLQACLNEQGKAARAKQFYEFERLDTQFHVLIAEGAKNDLLRRQLEISYDQIWFSRVGNLVSLPEYSLEETLAGHQRILDAIRRRDPGVARAEMYTHLRSAILLSARSRPHGRSPAAPRTSRTKKPAPTS
ncbi:GntR family transcriptional regulator [Acetobacter farinalis]|uniref:GntR family transcriptional regulator n=1 Tax=Acetobacter farinalis TaxID=1260984 RepID=A0ABT3Q8T7_9PROT|nr:GntR family transcriptional regulator [Acetobacter farinalis]MCX2561702.1 GntR family transcriptional regulator [Acetobacter farinalis]NHO30199.1 FCD domain-containing protein [Acetobacter farinalis]